MNIIKLPKGTKSAIFFKKLIISQKLSFKLFFFKPVYISQNQDSGLHAKKSGAIFFKPKLLTKKHGEIHNDDH